MNSSTHLPRINNYSTTTTMSSSDKASRRARFEQAWVAIRDELLENFAGENMPEEAIEWYKANLDYNVPGGKLNRGISVCDTVEILKGAPLTEEEYKRAAVLGWSIELLQGFFLVSDDIMDSSITRRGQPCWYRVPKIGMIAINDSFMLEAPIYWLIKKYFRRESYYADLVDLFHETTYQTEMGQLVDLITAPEDHVDLTKFSLERHRLIVIYKTAFYSFYLPVACAMMISGIPFPTDTPPRFSLVGTSLTGVNNFGGKEINEKRNDPYSIALSILIPLGEYFQVQDDFLDYSAPPEVLGKIGTDIVDNKCSWVINTALALASSSTSISTGPTAKLTEERKAELRKVLDESYGQKNKDAEERVKGVYRELGIPWHYKNYEETVVGELRRRIGLVDESATGLKREVFESFLGKIYGRSK
ncbi:farnesyldiphosphatesynthetase [Coprinopsis marcescibilis]|uniref:(2E,6E)-farnesyl diphosphate synthase n=1 Tax=Coprinopsis marcescibilis TaxID=230819 RepID=A0A5C3KU22_COPMA|nr:farnesyldiphosphatesynthetase [Coprinopsis marcescibilis]